MPRTPIIPAMPQFGGSTIITGGIRLILIDCFETLVEMRGRAYQPRLGVKDFLTHYASKVGIPVAVVSDANQAAVDDALRQAGLATYITRIYHADNAAERLPDGRARKRLDVPLRDFALRPEQVVFVGDSPLDAEAAQHHKVQFIRVPRSEDAAFSFASLITGPSRYRSQEFQATFLNHYLERKPGSPDAKPDGGDGK